MYRRLEKVELMAMMGNCKLRQDGKTGDYITDILDGSLAWRVPSVAPLAEDNEPFRFRPALCWERPKDDHSHPLGCLELAEALVGYTGLMEMRAFAGSYDKGEFWLTDPRDASHLFLEVLLDPDDNASKVEKSLDFEPAARYHAQWYYHAIYESDGSHPYLDYDYWVIEVPDSLRKPLQQCSEEFARKVDQADIALHRYEIHREQYHKDFMLLFGERIAALGWYVRLYDIESQLMYVDGGGEVTYENFRYDAYGFDHLNDLLCIAEEQQAGGVVD